MHIASCRARLFSGRTEVAAVVPQELSVYEQRQRHVYVTRDRTGG